MLLITNQLLMKHMPQLDNGIPITSWYEDRQDRELLALVPFLRRIVDEA